MIISYFKKLGQLMFGRRITPKWLLGSLKCPRMDEIPKLIV